MTWTPPFGALLHRVDVLAGERDVGPAGEEAASSFTPSYGKWPMQLDVLAGIGLALGRAS